MGGGWGGGAAYLTCCPGGLGYPLLEGILTFFFQNLKKFHNTYHDVGPQVEVGLGEGAAYLTCCPGCQGYRRLEGEEGEGVDPWSLGYSYLCRDVGGSESDSLLLKNTINIIEIQKHFQYQTSFISSWEFPRKKKNLK